MEGSLSKIGQEEPLPGEHVTGHPQVFNDFSAFFMLETLKTNFKKMSDGNLPIIMHFLEAILLTSGINS